VGAGIREVGAVAENGKPSDIADAVIYLATAEFLTGHTLVVDAGGWRRSKEG